MEYELAIVSHRRADILKAQTLAYLQGTDVDLSRVSVLVSDDQDMLDYKDLPVEVIKTDMTCIRDKFNWLHFHYEPKTRVFVMEDDITIIGKDKKPVQSLDRLIQEGFHAVGMRGIFGLAPHSNTFYMSGKVTRTLKLVVAHAFGFVSTHDPALEVSSMSKTDYERTCRYFSSYGEVVRLDSYGVKTNSYTQKGGMQSQYSREERERLERESCEYIVRTWPHLIEHNLTKKSLFPELSFKKLRASNPW